jgi:preprotein translocase subunit SecD
VRAFLTTCLLLLAVACGDGKRSGDVPVVVLLYEVAPLAGQTAAQAQTQALAGIRQRLDARALDHAGVWPEGDARVRVELGGKDVPVDRMIELIGRSAVLGIHVVVHDDPGMKAMYQAVAVEGPTGISAETDSWSGPDGVSRTDVLVSADDRARLEAWVQAKGPRAAELGDRKVVYERVGQRWRAYLVEKASIVGGADVAQAEATYDAQPTRPIVQVDLSDGGRARFSDATEAAIGRKLAIVLDGRVVSAPVVQSRIPGGRIQITMGGSDLKEQEREAHDLVEVLRAGSMPPLVLIERRDVGPAR